MNTKFIISLLTVAGTLATILTLSNCESTTDFPPAVNEICTDNIDNDGDGLTDCKDSECDKTCGVQVTVTPVSDKVTEDTLSISGTHVNAQSISITIAPSGIASAATINGNTWTAKLSQLVNRESYTATIVAKDAQNGTNTVTLSFDRQN
jgi:hypothetical protein